MHPIGWNRSSAKQQYNYKIDNKLSEQGINKHRLLDNLQRVYSQYKQILKQ